MKTSRFFLIAACAALATVFTTNINASDVASETTTQTESTAIMSSSNLVEKTHYDRVEPYSTDRYTQTFYAGESVWIYVKGDGDTDLDLYIYDSYGNLVTSDTDSGDMCLCSFTPRRTQRYTIRIKNLGSVYNNYKLIMLQ